jgi:hypothetical protein
MNMRRRTKNEKKMKNRKQSRVINDKRAKKKNAIPKEVDANIMGNKRYLMVS